MSLSLTGSCLDTVIGVVRSPPHAGEAEVLQEILVDQRADIADGLTGKHRVWFFQLRLFPRRFGVHPHDCSHSNSIAGRQHEAPRDHWPTAAGSGTDPRSSPAAAPAARRPPVRHSCWRSPGSGSDPDPQLGTPRRYVANLERLEHRLQVVEQRIRRTDRRPAAPPRHREPR